MTRPRFSIVALFLLLALFATGCCGVADNAFTKAADEYSNTVGVEWIGYVTADESKTLLEKQTRIDTHLRFREAVAAKKEADSAASQPIIGGP